MAITDKVRVARGNKGNLPANATLGVPLATLDTKELFIGQGPGQPLVKISDVVFAAVAPADITKLWIDTTTYVIKGHNGTAWVALSEAAAAASFASLTGAPGDNAALVAAFATKADAAATTTALAGKADAAATTTALAGKADVATTYTKTEVNGLISAIPSVDAYTKAEVDTKIADVVGTAPANLDTLQEIAAALADDDTAIAGIITTLGNKANASDVTTALAGKADTATTYTKVETDAAIDAAIGSIPGGETITASTGLTKVGSDIQLAASAAGAGLSFAAGVLTVDDIDGGSF